MTQIGLLTGDFDAYLVARNFSALKRWIQPPARNAKPILAGQSDGDVAIGWVDYVTARDRSTIVVDLVGVPPKVQAALAAGGVTARGEFYPSWSDTTAAKNLATDAAGPVLSSIVLHGLDLPACSDIDCVCATLLHERVVTSPGNQAVADLAWKRFRESGDARYARVLRLVADDVPAAVLRADAAPLPASMQERQTAAFAVLGGAPLEMKETLPMYTFDEEGAAAEVDRLAEKVMADRGWPTGSDTAWHRAYRLVYAEHPHLDPNVAEDRMLREAVRYVATQNGLDLGTAGGRREALTMLSTLEEYSDRLPPRMRRERDERRRGPYRYPQRNAEPPAPPIPPPCKEAVATLSEALGVSWATASGRTAIVTALGRQQPELAAQMPPELQSHETRTRVKTAQQAEAWRDWQRAQSPYGREGA